MNQVRAAAMLLAVVLLVPPAAASLAATPVEDMSAEMSQAYVRGIQEELADHGYDPGPVDGLVGPATRAAIRKYQRDARLAVDGVASRELLDHLKFAQPRITARPDPEPDPLVLTVQTRLQALGYYRGALDGWAGGATREAIRAYRYDAGLPISGAIDGPLLSHLRAAEFGAPDGPDTPEGPELGPDRASAPLAATPTAAD